MTLNKDTLREEWEKLYGDDIENGLREKYLNFWLSKFDQREQEIVRLAEEVEKAFGGCRECYGKGYSSQNYGIHGAEDFGGNGFDILPSVHMNFCTCGRGKQLSDLIFKMGNK